MKTNATQKEILLFKHTSFTNRQLFEKEALENNKNLSYDEQLEVACWNGWLDAMLPELVDSSATGTNLYLWEILQAKSFLNIELCEYPQLIDVQYSINPYAVLSTVCYE